MHHVYIASRGEKALRSDRSSSSVAYLRQRRLLLSSLSVPWGAKMASALIPRIHPTAVIAPEVELAADVQIGPYAVIEGPVHVGAGCIVRAHAYLCGPLTMGRGNVVFTGAV